MNEAETRAEYVDPKLKEAGWGEVEGSKVLREFRITDGRIQIGGGRGKPDIADYVLVYRNQKLAVIEAKPENEPKTKGLGQAKDYALKLKLDFTYSTNGKEIFEVNMVTGEERDVERFPTPQELWYRIHSEYNSWKEKFADIPFEDVNGTKPPRYYQEIAVNKTLDAIADGKQRILLNLATGTGKTFIAFQIAWKLFQSRWNLQGTGERRPRILFLADRNILADQAYLSFGAFDEDALIRISPLDIRKKGKVPTNGSIFFTIFQTFMSGKDNSSYFGDYPEDFFDLIIIDECHRGGANDESNWRAIMEYFSPAVQLGLTATPKRKDNTDTYRYFGEPVYTYSLKEGVNDGFLTPFKVKQVSTTLDEYIYTPDDDVVEGEVEEGKIYTEPDFNRIIEIKERESKRVKVVLEEINQSEKTIIFCANQEHALAVRDLVNKYKDSKDPSYCQRVTADDGVRGEQYLRDFQDNEKTIPTILTTSQKLSTGVDARNVRNIVLMRPVNSMIEFKQIIGRGTRLFEGKEFFTIIDFVNAYKHFLDPEWDGDPLEAPEVGPLPKDPKPYTTTQTIPDPPTGTTGRIKIKLRDGKELEIQHMIAISFWSADGKPISQHEFIQNLSGNTLPSLFKTTDELKEIWSNPKTRKELLEKIDEQGCGRAQLNDLQILINAEDSDLFDVLNYYAFKEEPVSKKARAMTTKENITKGRSEKEVDFIEFVLDKYIDGGIEELDEESLPKLLNLEYKSISDAETSLGGVDKIRNLFFEIQREMYFIS